VYGRKTTFRNVVGVRYVSDLVTGREFTYGQAVHDTSLHCAWCKEKVLFDDICEVVPPVGGGHLQIIGPCCFNHGNEDEAYTLNQAEGN
jgi:hypothetical protein